MTGSYPVKLFCLLELLQAALVFFLGPFPPPLSALSQDVDWLIIINPLSVGPVLPQLDNAQVTHNPPVTIILPTSSYLTTSGILHVPRGNEYSNRRDGFTTA